MRSPVVRCLQCEHTIRPIAAVRGKAGAVRLGIHDAVREPGFILPARDHLEFSSRSWILVSKNKDQVVVRALCHKFVLLFGSFPACNCECARNIARVPYRTGLTNSPIVNLSPLCQIHVAEKRVSGIFRKNTNNARIRLNYATDDSFLVIDEMSMVPAENLHPFL